MITEINSTLLRTLSVGLIFLVFCGNLSASLPDDEFIEMAITEALRDDPRVDSSRIQVSVNHGIVILSGSVETLASKKFALLEAKKIDGVTGILDHVEIKYSPKRSDKDIQVDVHKRLQLTASLTHQDINVSVVDGVVTLTGTVSTWAKYDEATLSSSYIKGVKRVQNKMEITNDSMASDLDIHNDLTAAIHRDVYLSGLPIELTVENQKVTLTGEVANLYQKERIETKIFWIPSVKELQNNITVNPSMGRGARKKAPVFDDKRRTEMVKSTLQGDPRISKSAAINVQVEAGHVTLRGIVPTALQKKIAERDARDVVGVMWVTNLLEVYPERRKDSEIRTDVLAMIKTDYVLLSHILEVHVKNGVVTLSGRVNSSFEKVHSGNLICRIRGVTKVVNTIAIKPPPLFPDLALEKRIKDRLKANAETKWVSESIKITVQDGKVTLTRTVSRTSERKEAQRVAYLTDGIWAVDNRLMVQGFNYDWELLNYEYPEEFQDWIYPGYDSFYQATP